MADTRVEKAGSTDRYGARPPAATPSEAWPRSHRRAAAPAFGGTGTGSRGGFRSHPLPRVAQRTVAHELPRAGACVVHRYASAKNKMMKKYCTTVNETSVKKTLVKKILEPHRNEDAPDDPGRARVDDRVERVVPVYFAPVSAFAVDAKGRKLSKFPSP
ncbi:hypothetical protein ON010_g3907 [Phytophthora cinnamomi]|nr:hypothetical protein ON010_g3907 [Phytophthora cinnamomi]